MAKTAVAYARFSSDKQRSESIDAQLRAIRAYCKTHDIELIKTYADSAITGTMDNRPAFKQMMREVTKNPCDYVIVHKLDRFARNRYDNAVNERKLNLCGASVVSVLENFDDSPEAVILKSVIVGMNEYYSLNLARETMKGLTENALKCKHTGGSPPLGYDVDEDKNYILNPVEAESVRMIFEMYLSGHGYGEIVSALNARGFRTKRGAKFGKNSIYDILGNEKYTGTFIWNKSYQAVNGKFNRHKHKDKKDIIRIDGGIPAIITREQFEEVQAMRKRNKKISGSFKSKRVYLLSGLIECPCGAKMVGNSRTGERTYHYYTCNERLRKKTCKEPSINADYIEDLVLSCFQDLLFTESNIRILVHGIYNYLAETDVRADESDIDALIKQKREIDEKIQNGVDAIMDGVSSTRLADAIDELERQSSYLEIAIKKAEIEKSSTVTEEEIYEYIYEHRDIRTFSPQEQKMILANFIDKIKISEDGFHLVLKTLVDSTSSDILDIHGGEGGIRTHVPRRTN